MTDYSGFAYERSVLVFGTAVFVQQGKFEEHRQESKCDISGGFQYLLEEIFRVADLFLQRRLLKRLPMRKEEDR